MNLETEPVTLPVVPQECETALIHTLSQLLDGKREGVDIGSAVMEANERIHLRALLSNLRQAQSARMELEARRKNAVEKILGHPYPKQSVEKEFKTLDPNAPKIF